MKQKIQFLLLATVVVALTGLFACTKDNNGGKTVDGEKTYTRIMLTQSSSDATKGAPTNAHQPTPAEKEVKSATLYIFKEPTKVLDKIVTLTVTGSVVDSKVFEMTTGQHSFYVVINGSALTGTIAVGATLSTFEQKILDIANIATITGATNGFLITNVEKAIAVNVEKANEAEANGGTKNNFTFKVGRAMAKVNMEYDPLTAIQTGGKLTAVEYKVNAQPNKMHLMPSYNTSGVFFTPYHFDATPTAAEILTKYFDNPTFLASDGTVASYIMENSNDKPLQGTSSYLLIKGAYIPLETVDTDGANPLTPTVAADFWRIKKADGIYTNKVYREIPSGAELIAAGVGAAIKKYDLGVCYYSYFISRQSLGTVNIAFDIKRNSYYYITIVSVSGPGESTPGEVIDPVDPVVTSTWIKATIEHLDWELIDQSGGI